jgi:hypothetical protein
VSDRTGGGYSQDLLLQMLCYALIAASGVYVEVISNFGIGHRWLNDSNGSTEVGLRFVFIVGRRSSQ